MQDLTAYLMDGNPYSERQNHAILDANLRPVYEEQGYLKVAFALIGTEKAADLKIGGVANWKTVAWGVARMLIQFQRNGYIAAKAPTARTFHDDSGTVDVGAEISRLKIFRIGKFEITGLTDRYKLKAEGLWKLQPGTFRTLPTSTPEG